MKKTYINPVMEIVKVQTQQMLAASTMSISDEKTSTLDARGYDFDDED